MATIKTDSTLPRKCGLANKLDALTIIQTKRFGRKQKQRKKTRRFNYYTNYITFELKRKKFTFNCGGNGCFSLISLLIQSW